MMDEHNQPFRVIGAKGRFRGARFGYLPAIEASNDDMETMAEKTPQQEWWNRRQWDTVQQLRGELLYLKKKFISLEELVTAKGYKPRYK